MTYNKKEQIVNTILCELDKSGSNPHKDVDIEKIVFDWFVTGRQGSGLRLTDAGKSAFEYASIEHFDIDIEVENLNVKNARGAPQKYQKFLLALNEKIQSPYYIGTKKIDSKMRPYIRLYDGKIAMMMTLYGDIYSYLESL